MCLQLLCTQSTEGSVLGLGCLQRQATEAAKAVSWLPSCPSPGGRLLALQLGPTLLLLLLLLGQGLSRQLAGGAVRPAATAVRGAAGAQLLQSRHMGKH